MSSGASATISLPARRRESVQRGTRHRLSGAKGRNSLLRRRTEFQSREAGAVTGRTWSAGDDSVGVDPGLDRRRLVEDNVALARHLARRFSGPHGANPDTVQVAMVGLVEAANRFDPSYGVPFAAFATKTIVGELKRHRRDTGWNVHVARRTKEIAVRLPRAVQALSDELGRSPTPGEVAGRLGVSVDD